MKQKHNSHKVTRICHHRKLVAEPVSVTTPVDPLPQHPELQEVKIHCDLTAPLSKDEWPDDYR